MKAGTCQEGCHLGGSLKDRTHHDTLLRIIRKADAIATIIETIECRGSELCLLDDLQCPRRESEVHKAIGKVETVLLYCHLLIAFFIFPLRSGVFFFQLHLIDPVLIATMANITWALG